jgi:hypothetical protein
MAWSYTNNRKIPLGNGYFLSTGSFTDGATSAGQSVVTGLEKVVYCQATSTIATPIRCVESSTKGTLTIVVTTNGTDDGFWLAIGR